MKKRQARGDAGVERKRASVSRDVRDPLVLGSIRHPEVMHAAARLAEQGKRVIR